MKLIECSLTLCFVLLNHFDYIKIAESGVEQHDFVNINIKTENLDHLEAIQTNSFQAECKNTGLL